MNVTLPDDVTDGERNVRVWAEETRDDSDFRDSAVPERFPSRDSARVARLAARPTTPPKTLARAFPLASAASCSLEETRPPTSRMRCASHSSSARGVGRGTETRAARRREMRFENEGGASASRRNGGAKGFIFLVNGGGWMFSSRAFPRRRLASSFVRVSVRSALRDACHVAGASLVRVAKPARFERGVADDARFREDVPARVSDRRARARAFFSPATESRREAFDRERNAPVTRVSLNEPRGEARDARGEDRRSRWRRARTDANNRLRLMRAWVSPVSSRRAVAGRTGLPTPRDGPNTGCAEKGGACGFARVASWSKRVPSVDGSRDGRRTTCTVTGVRAISRLYLRVAGAAARFRCDEPYGPD